MSVPVPLDQRIRGQRISHQELVAEAQAVLLRSGVKNQAQADFINLLSKVVVGNPNPIFCQLQPRIRESCSPSWLSAWDLVSSYIAQNNLALTLDTLNVELSKTKQKLRLTLKETGDADQFNELLSSSASGLSDSEQVVRRGRPQKKGAIESGSDAESIDEGGVLSPPRARAKRSRRAARSPK
jgi:hypothetical protein